MTMEATVEILVFLSVFSVSFSLDFLGNSSSVNLKVNTKVGTILGRVFVQENKQIGVFWGVPYATPPLEQYRFVKPLKQLSLGDKIFDATKEKSKCVKDSNGSDNVQNGNILNYEDCLYLDIFKPLDTNRRRKRGKKHVVILLDDKNSEDIKLTVKQIVQKSQGILVRVDYRSGVFGFFGTGLDLGNYGLFDQQLAIKWVYENIKEFGGDRSNITLLGLGKSGGIFAGLYALSPLSYPYIHRVIMHENTPFHHLAVDGDPHRFVRLLARNTKCPIEPHVSLLKCLRSISAPDLHRIASSIRYEFRPVIDGDFLQNFPEKLIQTQIRHKIDFMIGTTAEYVDSFSKKLMIFSKSLTEGAIFKESEKIAELYYGKVAQKLSHLAQIEYGYCSKNDTERFLAFAELVQDVEHLAPTDLAVRLYNDYTGSTYYYNVLNNNQNTSSTLSKELIDYWIQFVGQRNMERKEPTVHYMAPWTAYSSTHKTYMQFTTKSGLPRIKKNFREAKMEFWNQYGRAIKNEQQECKGPLPCQEYIKSIDNMRASAESFWIVLSFLILSVILNVVMVARITRKDTRRCYRTLCCRPAPGGNSSFVYRYKTQLPYFEETIS